MKFGKPVLFSVLLLGIIAFFVFDFDQYLTLDYFKAQQQAITAFYQANPWQTAFIFFVIYVIVTALSVPGAAVMTLVGGAIFGLGWGTLIISFASTLGATLAFLVSRFLLRDAIQQRFRQNLQAINQGIAKEGAFYLFTLRLVPAFPFFVINLVMGLTPLKTWTFYWVSQIGMLPGTLVYVNAGTQIAEIETLSGILSLDLMLSFVLLGVFPLLAKKVIEWIKQRRTLQHFQRPRTFDRNLIVIGGGSGGLVSAYIAAAVKAKVTLIEKNAMGGDCLNTGCVPSKALIRTTRLLAEMKRAEHFGLKPVTTEVDFSAVMARVQRVIQQIAPHDSIERYQQLGVECLQGEAVITSPYSVRVNGQQLTAPHIIIAAGARPFIPALPGLAEAPYYTSDTLWQLTELPKQLVVLGGGPIGCELAQCFARLGSAVTLLQRRDRLLPREDPEFSVLLQQQLQAEGITLAFNCEAQAITQQDTHFIITAQQAGQTVSFTFDTLLLALGRVANTQGYGLEALNIRLRSDQTIAANEFLQTTCPTIYVCGDVTGPYQFTHVASHQAWFASVNALFGRFKRFAVDYRVIPHVTFTEPEIAHVGLNEQQAKAQGIAYEVTTYALSDLDRAIADECASGLVKVLTVPGKDRILGATIAGAHAGEILTEFVAAMRHGFGLSNILSTVHAYPTFAEANKYAAGAWKRAHQPNRLLRWIAKYHAWERGE